MKRQIQVQVAQPVQLVDQEQLARLEQVEKLAQAVEAEQPAQLEHKGYVVIKEKPDIPVQLVVVEQVVKLVNLVCLDTLEQPVHQDVVVKPVKVVILVTQV